MKYLDKILQIPYQLSTYTTTGKLEIVGTSLQSEEITVEPLLFDLLSKFSII